MTFPDAVKSGFDHYTKFDGRASRPAYWWWGLFNFGCLLAAAVIDAALGPNTTILYVLVWLALLSSAISVAMRRLHDTGRSGAFLLLAFIPIIGWLVLLIFYLEKSDNAENRFGPVPTTSPGASP